MSTPGVQTEAEIQLQGSKTSPAFSIAGNWTLEDFGVWRGTLRLETRDNEEGRWRPTLVVRGTGQPHPFGRAAAHNKKIGMTSGGGFAFYRLVFKDAAKGKGARLLLHFGDVPLARLTADKLVIDP